jgi:crossover junction endodeoxyribonuclease RusA
MAGSRNAFASVKMEIAFPIEFLVEGTPASLGAKRPSTKEGWKDRVKKASSDVIQQPHFASRGQISVTIYYFPARPMLGDVDNIVKLILDALCRHIYVDDRQVERIVVQKFEPGSAFKFSAPSPTLLRAMEAARPVVYIRISNDPFEDLR